MLGFVGTVETVSFNFSSSSKTDTDYGLISYLNDTNCMLTSSVVVISITITLCINSSVEWQILARVFSRVSVGMKFITSGLGLAAF